MVERHSDDALQAARRRLVSEQFLDVAQHVKGLLIEFEDELLRGRRRHAYIWAAGGLVMGGACGIRGPRTR